MHRFGFALCFSFPQCTNRVFHKTFMFIRILHVPPLTPAFVPFVKNVIHLTRTKRIEVSLAQVTSASCCWLDRQTWIPSSSTLGTPPTLVGWGQGHQTWICLDEGKHLWIDWPSFKFSFQIKTCRHWLQWMVDLRDGWWWWGRGSDLQWEPRGGRQEVGEEKKERGLCNVD